MHSVFHQNCPPYLRDLVEFVNDDPTKRRLRSATTRTAATVRARTKLGDRAFSVAAPSTWNNRVYKLPPHLRHIDSHRQFRKQLKHICSNRLLTCRPSCFYICLFSAVVLILLYVQGGPIKTVPFVFTCVSYAEARNRYRLDVRPSVRLSVRHTLARYQNG